MLATKILSKKKNNSNKFKKLCCHLIGNEYPLLEDLMRIGLDLTNHFIHFG